MNKIYTILLSIAGVISGIIASYFVGKNTGKSEEKNKANEKVLKVANDFKKSDDIVNNLNDDAVRDELRKYSSD